MFTQYTLKNSANVPMTIFGIEKCDIFIKQTNEQIQCNGTCMRSLRSYWDSFIGVNDKNHLLLKSTLPYDTHVHRHKHTHEYI